jgi:hypothetical protein
VDVGCVCLAVFVPMEDGVGYYGLWSSARGLRMGIDMRRFEESLGSLG